MARFGWNIIQDELKNNATSTALDIVSDMVIRVSKTSAYSEMPDFAKLAMDLAE